MWHSMWFSVKWVIVQKKMLNLNKMPYQVTSVPEETASLCSAKQLLVEFLCLQRHRVHRLEKTERPDTHIGGCWRPETSPSPKSLSFIPMNLIKVFVCDGSGLSEAVMGWGLWGILVLLTNASGGSFSSWRRWQSRRSLGGISNEKIHQY